MDNFNIPLSVLLLEVRGISECSEQKHLLPKISNGDSVVFEKIFNGKIKLSIKIVNGVNTLVTKEEFRKETAFRSMFQVNDINYGFIRFTQSNSIFLYKILQSAEVFVLQIDNSIEYEKYFLELLIQGFLQEPTIRLASS